MADTEVFKFDLDNAEFVKKLLESKNLVLDVGDSKNLSGLVEALSTATAVAATLGVAYLTVKTAIDWTEEAEKIKLVDKQFVLLAEGVGLVAHKLKSELIAATGGMADEVEVLESANRAIIELGTSAGRMGEIMEMARKVTAVMGGDLIANFEGLNRALASGNQRMLRQYGIYVDTNKAVRDYAATIGEASGNLSEMGKRHAILEAAMSQLHAKYKDIDADTGTTIQTFAKFKATLKDIGDTFVLVFDKVAGPTVRGFAHTVADLAASFKMSMQAVFGDETVKAQAQADQLKLKMEGIRKTIEDLKKTGGENDFASLAFSQGHMESAGKRIEGLEAQLKSLTAEYEAAETKAKTLSGAKAAPGGAKAGPAATGEGEVDKTAKLAAEQKYYADIAALQVQYEKQSIAAETNIATVGAHIESQKVALTEATEAKIQKIKQDTHLNEEQKNNLELAERRNLVQQLNALDQQRLAYETNIINNLKRQQSTASKEFANGWKAATLQAKQNMNDWAARGQSAATGTTDVLVAGFKAVGAGSESMSSAMKKALLSALGERAIAEGTIMILSGIWPPNPLAIAGGGALVALGAKLQSMAGAGGGGVSAATAGAGGGGGSGGGTVTTPEAPPAADTSQVAAGAQQNTTGRHVSLNIHGAFINTEENARWIMEMMRKETDTTAFDFYKVGGK